MNSITPNPFPSQQSTVTNWKDFATETQDDHCEFSVFIAKRAGWTVVIDDKYISIESADGKHGKQFFNGHPLPGGVEQAWRMGYWHGVIPHYTTDLNASFQLANAQTHIRTRRGKQDEQIWGVQLNLQDETHQDTSLAIAICKAWLSWYDWREDLYARIDAEQDENGGQS